MLLSTDLPSLRLQHVTNVLAKQLSIVEVSSKIATAVDESLSKQQKALFLRQQLAAINAELQRLEPGNTDLHGTGNGQEDEDELELLIRRVDTLPAGSEVRRVASSEARRLKRIPPQNAEHGVVRNYVRRSMFSYSNHTLNPDTASPARMAHFAALDSHHRRLRNPHAIRFPRQISISARCGSLRTREG